jgi:hypothetical protein
MNNTKQLIFKDDCYWLIGSYIINLSVMHNYNKTLNIDNK